MIFLYIVHDLLVKILRGMTLTSVLMSRAAAGSDVLQWTG
jgi:hypothetical protein